MTDHEPLWQTCSRDTDRPALPLRRKYRRAVQRSRAYRKRYGDPVDNLCDLLGEVAEDEETWRRILEEPYG
jgi:hypothetical protein